MPELLLLSDKDQKIVDAYYTLWLEGKLTEPEIAEALGIPETKLKALLPHLMAACRYRLRQDTASDLVKGFPPDRLQLTPRRKAEFLANMAAAGGDLATVCRAMGLPLPTVTEVWYAQDPILKEEAEAAFDQTKLNAIKKLIKKVNGYAWDYESSVTTEGEAIGKNGEPVSVSSTSTTRGRKRAEPCFNSLRFYLINAAPDKFSLDGFGNRGSSKGKILAAIESMVNTPGTEADEAAFDAEAGIK
jgi:hypothetical protein